MHLFFFLQKISDEPKLIQTENSSNERFVSLDFFFQIRLKNLNDNNSNTYDQKESFPSKVELDRFQIWIKILTNSNDGFRVQKKIYYQTRKKCFYYSVDFDWGINRNSDFFSANWILVELRRTQMCAFLFNLNFLWLNFPKTTQREKTRKCFFQLRDLVSYWLQINNNIVLLTKEHLVVC